MITINQECGEQLYGDFGIDQSVDALNASLFSSASEDGDLLASPSNTAMLGSRREFSTIHKFIQFICK